MNKVRVSYELVLEIRGSNTIMEALRAINHRMENAAILLSLKDKVGIVNAIQRNSDLGVPTASQDTVYYTVRW